MSLRRQLAWVGWGSVGSIVPAACVASVLERAWVPSILVIVVLVVGARRFGAWLVWRLAWRRYAAFDARNDIAGAKGLLAEMRELAPAASTSPRWKAHFAMNEATLDMKDGAYQTGRAKLEAIDEAHVEPRNRIVFQNNLAWARAVTGDAGTVPLAREVLAACDDPAQSAAPLRAMLRPYALGTLGGALVAAREHAEAVDVLREALATGGPGPAQAARAFFLGEALAGLGRDDEALEAYQRAASTAPTAPFGKRAAAKLSARKPYR